MTVRAYSMMPAAREFFIAACCVGGLVAVPALAQSGQTVEPRGTGTIIIQQINPSNDVSGSWTLLRPDRTKLELSRSYTIDDAAEGSYTLIATLPQGAGATTTLSRNGTRELDVGVPQVSFTLQPGDTVHVTLTFSFTRTGTVSVTSQPTGLSFTLEGPNGKKYTGTTPGSFLDVPEGLYTVRYDPIRDCATPTPQSDRLIKGSRIAFGITISCANLHSLPQMQQEQKKLLYVTLTVDGQSVSFEDVPLGSWFAPYVSAAVKTAIMTGYKDEAGAFTGVFGPGDHVTLAQLLKIAHGIAGIDEQKARGSPQNLTAETGAWYTPYVVSAEQRGWLVFRDRRKDLRRPATRGEVLCTLLQALDISRLWPKGDVFTDVSPATEHADCIETAAHDDVIEHAEGGAFRPGDPINRAEMAKLIATASATYVERTAEIRSYKQEYSSSSAGRRERDQ